MSANEPASPTANSELKTMPPPTEQEPDNDKAAFCSCEFVFGVRCGQEGDSCGFSIVHHIRFAVWVLVLAFFFVVVALAIRQIANGSITVQGTENRHTAAIVVCAIFSAACTVITILQIRMHLRHYTHPEIQQKIIKIVCMAPVYAWSAFLGELFVNLSVYIAFARTVYEAYVIFNFFKLLMLYLGGEENISRLIALKSDQTVAPPCCCCLKSCCEVHTDLFRHLKRGTLQFVIIAPIVAFISCVGGATGHYTDGDFSKGNLYPFCTLVTAATRLTAIYCLLWFYICMRSELKPFNPIMKLAVIKCVVFLTFFQGLFLAALTSYGVIQANANFTNSEVQEGLQDFLVCIEMFFAAIAHRYAFGHEEFADQSFAKTHASILASGPDSSTTAIAV